MASSSGAALATSGKGKGKKVALLADDGSILEVNNGGRAPAYPAVLASDSCGEQGWTEETARRAAISQQYAIPVITRVKNQMSFRLFFFYILFDQADFLF